MHLYVNNMLRTFFSTGIDYEVDGLREEYHSQQVCSEMIHFNENDIQLIRVYY